MDGCGTTRKHEPAREWMCRACRTCRTCRSAREIFSAVVVRWPEIDGLSTSAGPRSGACSCKVAGGRLAWPASGPESSGGVMPDGASRLVSAAMAAAALGVSRFQIHSWIRHGHLPAHQIGSRWWIRLEDLEAFTAPPEGSGDEPPN